MQIKFTFCAGRGNLGGICPLSERRGFDNGVVCVPSVVVGCGTNCERETAYQVCIFAFCGLFSQTVGVRCAFGVVSIIIRLSFGYLTVILRSCLLIGGCKDGILLVRLSLIYGILCAKSEGLFALARRIYSLKCTPYISRSKCGCFASRLSSVILRSCLLIVC